MSIALSILLGLIALWWALRFLPAGADGHGLMPYLIAFVRFLWIPSILILAVALVSRHWVVTIFAAILTILTGIFASPWYRKKHSNQTRRENPSKPPQNREIQHTDNRYAVMTLNCRYGQADPQAIIEAVSHNDVSILALQELTPNLVAALGKAGMNALLPYCQLGKAQESDNGGFNGIFSRAQPDTQAGSTVDIAAADVPHCTINGVSVYSAHPKSPMRGCREWSRGIINLAMLGPHSSGDSTSDTTSTVKSKTAESDDASVVYDAGIPQDGTDAESQDDTASQTGNSINSIITQNGSAANDIPSEAIIMGDLNSNLDHPSFRKLLDAGFEDAGLAASHGRAASFPQWLVWPRLELDHILTTSGIRASNVHTLAIPGSDHFALLAQLARA